MQKKVPIQLFTAMQGIGQSSPTEWTDLCKGYLKKIKAMKPKDRLEYASFVADLLFTISKVLQGWHQWYALEFNKPFSHNPLSDIPKEQFELIFEFFKTVAVNMLEFDIKVTEVDEKKFKDAAKKKKKVTKPNKKKELYVA